MGGFGGMDANTCILTFLKTKLSSNKIPKCLLYPHPSFHPSSLPNIRRESDHPSPKEGMRDGMTHPSLLFSILPTKQGLSARPLCLDSGLRTQDSGLRRSLCCPLPYYQRVDLLSEAVIMLHWKHHSHDNQECDAVHQEAKVNELKGAIGPLSGCSLQFCTDACLRRYLEARNWNVDKSKQMLKETLNWRTTYKPEEIRWHEVAYEGETGKVYRANFQDLCGRSVLVLRPGKQNTSSHDNQLRHLVYLIENAILNLSEAQEQMVWLIDFSGWSLTNSVPVKTTRETMNILQNHYPERLAAAFLYNPPRIFETFWRIVKYFLDLKTFQKVKFIYPKNEESIELMCKTFDVEVLPVEFGGKNNVQYDHEDFTKLMEKDDIKSAHLWGLDEKLSQIPHVTNGLLTTEIAPEPSHIVAHAS